MYFIKGALTSKPYSFVARPWEFKSINSVDFFDSFGSSVRIDIKGDKIIRVLPRLNDNTNLEWISDKTRFAVDGFRNQRIDTPLFKLKLFRAVSWVENLLFISVLLLRLSKLINKFGLFLNNGSIPFKNRLSLVNYITGAFSDFNSEYSFNVLFNTFVCLRVNLLNLNNFIVRTNYLFAHKLSSVIQYRNIALVGLNIRYDSPIFNIRLRQYVLKNNINVINFGTYFISTFSVLFLGGIKRFSDFIIGSHWLSANFVKQKSLVMFNETFAKMQIKLLNINNLTSIRFGVLSRSLSSLLTNEVGFDALVLPKTTLIPKLEIFNSLPLKLSKINHILFSQSHVHSDDINRTENTIRVNFSHHGDTRLLKSTAILPVSAPFEREGVIPNIEGRLSSLQLVLQAPKNTLAAVDLVVLIFTLLLKLSIKKLDKRAFILHMLFLNSYVFQKNTSIIWDFVSKFLMLTKDFKVSISMLLKNFNLMSLFVANTTCLESFDYYGNDTSAIITAKSFANNTITNCNEVYTNYYTQDEISSASFALSSANERLLPKLTYY